MLRTRGVFQGTVLFQGAVDDCIPRSYPVSQAALMDVPHFLCREKLSTNLNFHLGSHSHTTIFIRCSWDPTHDLITLWYPMLMGLLHSRIFMSKPLKVINIQLQYFKLTIHKVNRLQNEHWKLGHSHGSMCTIYSRQRKSWWTLALSCWPADVAFNSPKVNIFSLCST